MEAVLGLMVMLLGVSNGVETYCDGRQDGAQCYGALAGTVDIQLMKSNAEIFRFQLLKNKSIVLNVINNKVLSSNIQDRSLFITSNGTFSINNLSRNDSGKYILKTFNSDGTTTGQQTLQLFIQAPVSSVLLLSECLSQGEMRVSCSSEGGDSPQYSWTLDGRTLTDAELLSGDNEGNIITLKQHVSGHLVCSVRNNVSYVFTCGFIFLNCTSINATQISKLVYEGNNTLGIVPTAEPTITRGSIVGKEINEHIEAGNLRLISGVLAAPIIVLVVGVAVICAQRKKQSNKTTKQKDKEDDQEVMYAVVSIMQQQGNQVEQRQEAEVEYGHIKFSK